MPIALTASEADKAKYARILADVNLARGNPFRDPPTPEDLAKAAISLVGDGPENQVLERLQRMAMHKLLTMNEGKLATEIHRDLFYMGYDTDWAYSQETPEVRAQKTEAALDKFYAKHPECKTMSAQDALAKLTDTLWYEDKQPQAAVNADKFGGYVTGGGEFGGGYNEGVYAGFDNQISAEMQGSAEASFGGPNGVKQVQALLRMRYPQAYDDKHKGAWQHGVERIPEDGKWTRHDQELLLRFTKEANAGVYKDNPFPPPTAMRWGDVQKEYGARVFAGLINTQVKTAVDQTNAVSSNDRISPTSDGGINGNQIARMQLYLNALGYYGGNHPPSGVWTTTDKAAMQKWLDNGDHKENGFWKAFGWKDPYAGSTDNMSADQFKKILDKAAEEAKQKGLSDDLVPMLTNTSFVENPATPAMDRRNAPVVPPRREDPPPVQSVPAANAGGPEQIQNADAARLLAQMHLMNGYNGKYTGADADLNTALKAYAKSHPELNISGDGDLNAQQARIVKAAVQKDWETWAKNKDNAQKLKDIVDKGYEVGNADKEKNHTEVREMQTALLAMGGNLPSGVNGIYKGETAATLTSMMAEGGAYRTILDNAGVPHPAWGGSTNATPAQSVPKVDTTSGGFGDLLGAGGFIKPLPDPVAATPVVATQQPGAADPSRGFQRTSTPTGQPASPIVTTDTIRNGDSSVVSSYFNSKSNLPPVEQAKLFFKYDAQDIILHPELDPQARFTVTRLLQARDHKDQGQVFMMGPEGKFGRFAERYAYNAGVLTPVKFYDLNDPRQEKNYEDDLRAAAQKQGVIAPGGVPVVNSPNRMSEARETLHKVQPIVGGAMIAFLTLRNLGVVGH